MLGGFVCCLGFCDGLDLLIWGLCLLLVSWFLWFYGYCVLLVLWVVCCLCFTWVGICIGCEFCWCALCVMLGLGWFVVWVGFDIFLLV